METILREATAPAAPAAPRKRRSADRFARRLSKLSFEALDCLEEIMTDGAAKPADRIAAAKLTFDVMQRRADDPDDDGVVLLKIEGMPIELAE